MVIQTKEKIHIISRRLFDGDLRRHFVGVVEVVSEQAIRARGYIFVFDETINEFVRREKGRVRIFSLTDAGLIINLLPDETELDTIQYSMDDQGNRIITDGKSVSFNVSEFSARR